jgi:hypothetical protein
MELERATSSLVVGLAAATMGCATVSAPIGRTVTRGEVTARVEKAASRPVRETRVAVVMERVPPGTKLLGAFVATDGEPFCEGAHADMFSRSGAQDQTAPLSNGERVILEFPPAALDTLTSPSPRLDLLVGSAQGTHRCIPLELTDGERALDWEYDQRFTVGVDLSLEGFTNSLGSVTQLATIGLTAGMWIDRVRIDVGVGVGGAGCSDRYCEVEDPEESKIDYTTVFPLHAGVEVPVWEAGEFSFGVGARYRAVKLAADTRVGRESFWAHGPVLAPYLAAVVPVTPYGLGGSRLGFAGVEVPVGYFMAENGEHAVSVGFNLRMFFTTF